MTGTHFNKRCKLGMLDKDLGSSDVISVFTTELQLSVSLVLQCGILPTCGRIILIEYA